jgi:hypothetical protein
MVEVTKRTMSWLPRQSMYDEAVERRAKLKEQAANFIATQSSIAGTIGSIQSGLVSGSNEIISNIAAARMGIDLKA